uniref:Uncharacterized protein n=1 Tax=viral metagenome TaxID=1070528 RepID=A0A6C0ADK8_9ZZZZ
MNNELFYKNLEYNLSKIYSISKKISGKHYISSEKKELWISSQSSKSKKKAARLLMENTHYITFEEIIIRTEKIIRDINFTEQTYIFLEDKEDSTYFMSILAVNFIISSEKKFKKPIVFNLENDDIFLEIKSNPVLIFDDCIYSGNKMHKLLNKIHEKTLNLKIQFPKIHLFLVAMVSTSKNKLKNISGFTKDNFSEIYKNDKNTNKEYILNKEVTKEMKILREKFISLDLKIKIKEPIYKYHIFEEIYPLSEIICEKNFIKILYYFSPFAFGYPVVSLYFDHKIADATSTFLKILMYGPIIPKKLRYEIEDIEDSFLSNFNFSMEYDKVEKLINKLYEKNKTDNFYEIEFLGLINNCNMLKKLKKDFDIKQIDYNFFVMSNEIFKKSLEDAKNLNSNDEYRLNIINNEPLVNFLSDPQNRCPKSWYKEKNILK